jgi:hypothetical protein
MQTLPPTPTRAGSDLPDGPALRFHEELVIKEAQRRQRRRWLGLGFTAAVIVGAGLALAIPASHAPSKAKPIKTYRSLPLPTASVSTCAAWDLDASGGWQGATQTMLGAISFTNIGNSSCELRGFVKVELLNQNDAVLNVRTVHSITPALEGSTNTVRAIVLAPGKSGAARVPIQLSCSGPVPDVSVVRVVLPDGQSISVHPGANPWTVGSCNFEGPSILNEGPVQSIQT